MNKYKLFIFILFFSFTLCAKSYHFDSYEKASQSKEFIKFESESTKLGFITTTFDGYAKDFDVNYKVENNLIKEIFLTIKAESLDTDSESRDEKMHQQIIQSKKYQGIIFACSNPVELKEGTFKIKGRLTIKRLSKEKEIEITIKKKTDMSYEISGQSNFSLEEYKIPDPSIAIASVRDQFDIKFSLILTK